MRRDRRKIPGMLDILVSFTPWILYWTLCGMGKELGVYIAFAFSLLIIALRIFKKESNVMDFTSLLYFSAASVGVLFFNLRIFIEKSGFLGYFVLFLMAIISVLAGRPYTLQVSKKDYPEVYWRERAFLVVNYIISSVWAVIFLANSIIFLSLSYPYTVIVSNILIATGIAFSAVFPMKAPVWMTVGEFRKYDWRVDVDPCRSKGVGEFDVIIVGSGIGGLTCGALLSKRGYKVLVLERHSQVGGFCSSFTRMGFVFNTGVADVSGLWERGPLTFLLRELGLRKEDLFVENTTSLVFGGRVIEVRNLEEFETELKGMFPDEGENIENFFEEAKRAYEECYQEAQFYGTPLPAELIAKLFGERKLVLYPKEHPIFYDWLGKSFRQKLDEHFKSEDIKRLLSAFLGYLGTTAERARASSALTACISYYLQGGYYPKGGAQRFAESLRGVIEENGGLVLTGHRVDRILVEKGRVRGVRVGNTVFHSPVVVANANAKTTFLELVGRENLDEKFVKYIEGLRMSPSAFMVFLGVDMDLSEYPTLIKDLDGGYEIVVNSNADPDLAPPGKSSVTIITSAQYRDFPAPGTKEYLEKKERMANELIMKAERVIPGLGENIIVKEIATPRTLEKFTSMPNGAIYSFDQSIDVKRPYFKTPIRGLYLAGASTFPGGGIEGVVISGIICANDVCNWSLKN